MTEREALALLRREFQMSPTLPTGGISVVPSVALQLCEEFDRALVVVEAARRISKYRAEADEHSPWCSAGRGEDDDLANCPVCGDWVVLARALVAFGTGSDVQHFYQREETK